MKATLEDRLSEMALPMPDTLLPRVLAQAAQPAAARMTRAKGRRLWRTVAIAACVLLLALGVASYFAPRFAQALADSPVAGSALGPALRSIGLAGLQGRFTALESSATSAGYTIKLLAGYADMNQTILVFSVQPPDRDLFLSGASQPVLTDQFGRSLETSGGTFDSRTGESVITFAGVPWPDALVGARVSFHASNLQSHSDRSLVAGDWKVQGTIPVESTRSLPLPPSAFLGVSPVTFTAVQATDATLTIRFRVAGPLASQLDREVGPAIPGVSKPHPALTIQLFDRSGNEMIAFSQKLSGGGPTDVEASWVLDAKGDYRLVVNYEGTGQFERTITVA